MLSLAAVPLTALLAVAVLHSGAAGGRPLTAATLCPDVAGGRQQHCHSHAIAQQL